MPVELISSFVRSTGGSSDLRIILPSPDVRSIAACFFVYTPRKNARRTLAVADGRPGLCFPLTEAGYGFSRRHSRFWPKGGYLSGVYLEETYLEDPTCSLALLGARLTEEGLYLLRKEPVSHFRGKLAWELGDLFGPSGSRLDEAVRLSTDIPQKIAVVEAFFRTQATAFEPGNDDLVRQSVRLIRQRQGRLSVGELGRLVDGSYKKLERSFQRLLGVSPKEYTRLIRFLSAHEAIRHAADPDLLTIALENGYYDQNHLGKEFRKFTGASPLAYRQQFRRQL